MVNKIDNLEMKKMKKNPKFLIGLVSAILTFSIFFATVGKPKYFNRHHHISSVCNINRELNNK